MKHFWEIFLFLKIKKITQVLTRIEFGAIFGMWNQISLGIIIHMFTEFVIN